MASTGSNSTHSNSENKKTEKLFSHPFNIVPKIKGTKATRKHTFVMKKQSPTHIATKNYNLRPSPNVVSGDKENRGLTKFTSFSSSVTNANMKQLKTEANKTMQSFRTTIDSFSQRFRRTTRRRYRLEGGSGLSPTNNMDGQSPVKLYSPFCIDTPPRLSTRMGTPGRYTPRRCLRDFSSPSNTFRREVKALNRGTQQLNDVATAIVARGSLDNE